MMKNKIIIAIVVLVVIAVSFYGGVKYSQGQTSKAQASRFAGLTQGQGRQGMRGLGGNTNGEILSIEPTSLIIKLQNGGSKIVLFVASTTVSKMAQSSISDLKIGSQIMVSGNANSDGSVNALSIQEIPIRTTK